MTRARGLAPGRALDLTRRWVVRGPRVCLLAGLLMVASIHVSDYLAYHDGLDVVGRARWLILAGLGVEAMLAAGAWWGGAMVRRAAVGLAAGAMMWFSVDHLVLRDYLSLRPVWSSFATTPGEEVLEVYAARLAWYNPNQARLHEIARQLPTDARLVYVGPHRSGLVAAELYPRPVFELPAQHVEALVAAARTWEIDWHYRDAVAEWVYERRRQALVAAGDSGGDLRDLVARQRIGWALHVPYDRMERLELHRLDPEAFDTLP